MTENRFVIDRFPLVNEDTIKSIFEPGLSKLKRILITPNDDSINDDNSFVLLNINKLRYCNVGILLSKLDNDMLKIMVYPRDVFMNDDNNNNIDIIIPYDDNIVIEKATCFSISTSYVIAYIKQTCSITCEYFLENSVRMLSKKIDNIGLFYNSINKISFRDQLSKDENQSFIDNIILKENKSVFKFSSTTTESIICEARSLNTQKHIDIDLFYSAEKKNTFRLHLVPQDSGGTGGSRVWDASQFLAQWISFNTKIFKGRSIIELGSGLGLPGFAAATIGEKVAFTDVITEVLDNLRLNIEQNQNLIKATTKVFRLDWFEEDDRVQLERYDIVLIADVIYTSSIVDHLIDTVEACCANHVYVCMPIARMGASDFIYKMTKERGFIMKKVPIPSTVIRLSNIPKEEILETYIYHFENPLHINEVIARPQNIPNYFIAIRLKSDALKDMVDSFQERVVTGKFLKTRTSSKKMHLTLFIMRLYGVNEIEKAKEVFRQCDVDLNVSSDLLLSKVTFFGNKVMKIDVMKDNLYQQLENISTTFMNRFAECGLIEKNDTWSWEPHATIAKTSADRKNFKKLKFSNDIIAGEDDTFNNFPVRLTTIDLLQMNDIDDDGYYKTIEKKEFIYNI